MVEVLICTHGNSAQELLKSAEMICGEQKNCETVKFAMGESLDKLQAELDEKISLLDDTVICLTDLKGGTPFNTLVRLTQKYPQMEIVTGVNIPMLLQLFINREQMAVSELVNSIVDAGKVGVYRYQAAKPDTNDEDF
ncbi:PTS sugar transporter subunit IIA [Lactobacillus sp. ESL0677]|uniref:PTS sugar transporter subunit IIA n=1 Tax=Lactobacillus sp. ESL0677 TaxID=2983208 RepID=UPI0023F693FC|nr:PTS sugar transporter subunit IIA [Lactobacillus sp. ESL0677]WEV37412.1 PTS sugar transporter subunit IIA [Lactobacillus sp. ESL0677]